MAAVITCGRCIFWSNPVAVCRPHGEATEWAGECRRLAPRADLPRWPVTAESEGCGQGEAKAPAQEPTGLEYRGG